MTSLGCACIPLHMGCQKQSKPRVYETPRPMQATACCGGRPTICDPRRPVREASKSRSHDLRSCCEESTKQRETDVGTVVVRSLQTALTFLVKSHSSHRMSWTCGVVQSHTKVVAIRSSSVATAQRATPWTCGMCGMRALAQGTGQQRVVTMTLRDPVGTGVGLWSRRSRMRTLAEVQLRRRLLAAVVPAALLSQPPSVATRGRVQGRCSSQCYVAELERSFTQPGVCFPGLLGDLAEFFGAGFVTLCHTG